MLQLPVINKCFLHVLRGRELGDKHLLTLLGEWNPFVHFHPISMELRMLFREQHQPLLVLALFNSWASKASQSGIYESH